MFLENSKRMEYLLEKKRKVEHALMDNPSDPDLLFELEDLRRDIKLEEDYWRKFEEEVTVL